MSCQVYGSDDTSHCPLSRFPIGSRPTGAARSPRRWSFGARPSIPTYRHSLLDNIHHFHDEDLAWSQSLLIMHRALPTSLSLWLDFPTTPKDQNGMYFPWTVRDYPMVQAVPDRTGKAPLIVTKENYPKRPSQDPDRITRETSLKNMATGYEPPYSAGGNTGMSHCKHGLQLHRDLQRLRTAFRAVPRPGLRYAPVRVAWHDGAGGVRDAVPCGLS